MRPVEGIALLDWRGRFLGLEKAAAEPGSGVLLPIGGLRILQGLGAAASLIAGLKAIFEDHDELNQQLGSTPDQAR
jgi:hypothetical protein